MSPNGMNSASTLAERLGAAQRVAELSGSIALATHYASLLAEKADSSKRKANRGGRSG